LGGSQRKWQNSAVFCGSQRQSQQGGVQGANSRGVLLPWSKRQFGNQQWVFQQDSAPAHKAKSTQAWCAENLPAFISAQQWPPYSPDLNPMDYSVRSILESKACSTPHKSLTSLKRSLEAAWAKIDTDVLRKIVEKFPERLRAVIKAKEGYIES